MTHILLNVVKLFHKAINDCKTSMNVVQNKLCCNYAKCSTNNYFDTHSGIKVNLDVAIHVLTPRSAGQWPTQKPYKNHFLFQNECGRPCDFCRETDKVSWTNCACIVHPRSTIFGTYTLSIPILNNIKKFFK